MIRIKYSSLLSSSLVNFLLIVSVFTVVGISSDVPLISSDNFDDPVNIKSDADIAAYATSGNGTIENPYIIEDLNIASNETFAFGIYIEGITKHIKIQNVTIVNGSSVYSIGIRIDIPDGSVKIDQTNITNFEEGIYVRNGPSSSVKISNSLFNGNDIGLVNAINQVEIVNNKFTYNKYHGIYSPGSSATIANNTFEGEEVAIYSSQNDWIFNNTIEDSEYGMSLATAAIVANNSIINNTIGIQIDTIEQNYIIENNTLIGNGLKINHYYANTPIWRLSINNNTVNGKPLQILKDISIMDIDVSNYGQIFLFNVTDVTVRNQIISSSTTGIWVSYSAEIEIHNTTITKQFNGIEVYKSHDITIVDSHISESVYQAIEINHCDNVTILNVDLIDNHHALEITYVPRITIKLNTIKNNDFNGITVDNRGDPNMWMYGLQQYMRDGESISIERPSFGIIDDNEITGNLYGIRLNGIGFNQTQVINNIITDNRGYGILEDTSYYSTMEISENVVRDNIDIGIHSGGNLTLSQNNVINNSIGLYIIGLPNNTIVDNYISENRDNSISIYDSPNTTISANTLLGNVNNYDVGIDISGDTSNVFTTNNYLSQFDVAISIRNNNNSIIFNNTISEVKDGIRVFASVDISIINNSIFHIYQVGIQTYIHSSPYIENLEITGNYIFNSTQNGVYLSAYTKNAMLFNNYFYFTGGQIDNGINNTWYSENSQLGNYYSDYNGSGTYEIDGDAVSVDLYPMVTGDYDADQLPDWYEIQIGSDPLTPDGSEDFDEDGLTNLEEYNENTDPNNSDTDGDGMPDGYEVSYGLDPLLDDSEGDLDNDGMPNLWEYLNDLNPSVPDSDEDLDEDGLTNIEEYQHHTVANNNDTDGDGMPDGYEVQNNLDPTVQDANGDLDADGLSNFIEYKIGTDPNKEDTDGDGYSDQEEYNVGSDPLDPESIPNYATSSQTTTPTSTTSDIPEIPIFMEWVLFSLMFYVAIRYFNKKT